MSEARAGVNRTTGNAKKTGNMAKYKSLKQLTLQPLILKKDGVDYTQTKIAVIIPQGIIVEGKEITKKEVSPCQIPPCPEHDVKILNFTYEGNVFATYLSSFEPVTSSAEPTAKYYNATVQVAKYGYKVSDVIKVKSVSKYPDGHAPLGAQNNTITTVGKDSETWIVYFDANPKAIPELKLGDEVSDPTAGTATTPKDTIFTTKNILIAAAIALGAYLLFFAKEPILKINK